MSFALPSVQKPADGSASVAAAASTPADLRAGNAAKSPQASPMKPDSVERSGPDGADAVRSAAARFTADSQQDQSLHAGPSPSTRSRAPQNAETARLLAVTPANERSAAAQTIPLLLNEMKVQGVTDPRQKAYILATAEHESHFGANGYNVELGSGEQYEHRSDLGNVLPGDGPKFKGRGDIQITGRAAYTYYSQHLGVDLVQNPIAVIEPKTSVQIAVGGMKEGIYTGLHVHVKHVARDVVHETVTASGGQKA